MTWPCLTYLARLTTMAKKNFGQLEARGFWGPVWLAI